MFGAAAEVGGVMPVIDAKNAGVAGWYGRYGAVPLLRRAVILDSSAEDSRGNAQ